MKGFIHSWSKDKSVGRHLGLATACVQCMVAEKTQPTLGPPCPCHFGFPVEQLLSCTCQVRLALPMSLAFSVVFSVLSEFSACRPPRRLNVARDPLGVHWPPRPTGLQPQLCLLMPHVWVRRPRVCGWGGLIHRFRIKESQSILTWKGPTRTMEVQLPALRRTSVRVTACAWEPCPSSSLTQTGLVLGGLFQSRPPLGAEPSP